MLMVVLSYSYTIGDQIVNTVNGVVTVNQPNAISTQAYNSFIAVRDFLFSAITLFLLPFFLLLTFASSFINRNQTIISYLIQSLAVLMATPLVIFVFAQVTTNLLNVSILNANYIYTLYFNNFLYICIINMFLALASFVFVRQEAVSA